jgi:hypothetical protein
LADAVAEAVAAAAAAVLVVVRARDFRSNARSLEHRLIKPDGATAAADAEGGAALFALLGGCRPGRRMGWSGPACVWLVWLAGWP